jgi:hypothetical protein
LLRRDAVSFFMIYNFNPPKKDEDIIPRSLGRYNDIDN